MTETIGEQLVRLLAQRDVNTVFGIPGAHTIELYRGLANSGIHHVTSRHEQGAGFMADGYARISGKPGVAFVITGPGMLNIATPMAQAMADSIPMLVIAGVNPRPYLGMGSGNLHELHRQSQVASSCSVLSHTLSDARQLKPFLDKAFAVFQSERPGPVYLEVPVDLFAEAASECIALPPAGISKPAPPTAVIDQVARLLNSASTPLILVGGGASKASEAIRVLAETINAPVVMTTNARGVLTPNHPLAISASPSLIAVRQLAAAADIVLALGTEFGSTDYDMYERGDFCIDNTLIRVDIDSRQLHSGCVAELAVLADSEQFLHMLQPQLQSRTDSTAMTRAAETRAAAWQELDDDMQQDCKVLELLHQHFPTQPFIGDSTQLTYAGNLYGGASGPNHWFNSATGFGALGYGVPAAIGAAIASQGTTVCLIGDGGLQFCLAELIVAVQEQAHVVFIVWNNQGYGEIERYMRGANIERVGVALHTPDFVAIAVAMGLDATFADSKEAFETALVNAKGTGKATLIEIDEQTARSMAL
ncbi:5-guanidino-2-oxopentanoate decarboxylase [Granulosicoccus antarcticus]|uniref:Putative 2-ketoarginine decarboxylase AruI n=1 Tax=Granulosicoccus antarcticus IMCC3135 TaxID=1192854 RepID=A0A2Z2NU60_9GAMM|nr:5-guanidino-2-oxopentanoate decarboxylase [Granulosicoccus antarcticus]ASJ74793.1 putative 2-ketoarginine decarboxylase AruI [Granulosicoccus antarcticus IMCC3135]